MNTCMHFMHPPIIVQIGWGHHVNFCVWKKSAITFGEGCISLDINSSLPSPAYTRHWTGSALVQVMACRLFGAKPLPEPMPTYCHMDSWEQISVKFESESYHFHSRMCIWKCRLPERRPFWPAGDELNQWGGMALMCARELCHAYLR